MEAPPQLVVPVEVWNVSRLGQPPGSEVELLVLVLVEVDELLVLLELDVLRELDELDELLELEELELLDVEVELVVDVELDVELDVDVLVELVELLDELVVGMLTELLEELDVDELVELVELLDELVVGMLTELLEELDVDVLVELVELLDELVVGMLTELVEELDVDVLVELLLDELWLLEELLVDDDVLVLVVTPGQLLKSIVHAAVHTRNPPPAEPPGHVASPKSLPSHSSPGSRTPFWQSGAVLDVLVLVEVLELDELLVLVDVLVLVLLDVDELVLVLVVTPGQLLKSIVHAAVQWRNPPPAEPPGHVAPPKSVPSHSSPGSRTPFGQRGAVLDVLVLVEVVECDGLVVDVRELLDVLVEVDVVVRGSGPGQWQSDVQAWPSPQVRPSHSSPPARSSTPSPQRERWARNFFGGVWRARRTPVISSHPDATVMLATSVTLRWLPQLFHDAVILVAFLVPFTLTRVALPTGQPLSIDRRLPSRATASSTGVVEPTMS